MECPKWAADLPYQHQCAIIGVAKTYPDELVRKTWDELAPDLLVEFKQVGHALRIKKILQAACLERADPWPRTPLHLCRVCPEDGTGHLAAPAARQVAPAPQVVAAPAPQVALPRTNIVRFRSALQRFVRVEAALPERPPWPPRPARKPGPSARARSKRQESPVHPTIGQLSHDSGYHLSPAHLEILQLHRGIVICKQGWGLRDSKALEREYVTMTPAMSRHGRRRSWGRYKADRAQLVADGLLEVVGREPNGARRTRPAWHLVADPMGVWMEAARRQEERETNGKTNAQRTPSERPIERPASGQIIELQTVDPGPVRKGSPDFLTPKKAAADPQGSCGGCLREDEPQDRGRAAPFGGALPAPEKTEESLMGWLCFHDRREANEA